MRLVNPVSPTVLSVGSVIGNGGLQGAYYLGYGKVNAFASSKSNKKAGQLEKPSLQPFEFSVEFVFSNLLSPEEVDSVRNALQMMGSAGGLGGRSRRGWGSLTITSWTEIQGEKETQILERISADPRTLFNSKLFDATQFPDWSAWHQGSRVLILECGGSKDTLHLLNEIGCEMLRYRSWGKGGEVLGNESEKRFLDDHNFFKNKRNRASLPVRAGMSYPDRVAFGLPHNYGPSKADQVEPAEEGLDRRASPLFIHIHQLDKKSIAYGVLTFLPSRFLPGNAPEVNAFGANAKIDTTVAFYKPVSDFLDRLLGTGVAGNKNQSSITATEIQHG